MREIMRILASAPKLLPSYLGIVAGAVLVAATSLASPFIISAATDLIVDSVAGDASPQLIDVIWLAVGLLLATMISTVVGNWSGYLGDTTAARLRSHLAGQYFAHLMRLPQSWFDSERTGTIISRLNRSITEITRFLNVFANNLFPMLLTLFAALGITAYYYWPLAVLLILIYPAFAWLTALTSKRWQRLEGKINLDVDDAQGRFAEVIGQVKVTKSFTAEERELGRFNALMARTVATTKQQSRWWHNMDALRGGILNLIFFAIYAIIFVQTFLGNFSVGVMVLLIQLVNMARQPVMSMSYFVDTWQHAVAGSRDYFKVMAERPEPDPGQQLPDWPAALTTGAPAIEFEDVSFSYEEGTPVLSGISFELKVGQRAALVSESGGGKSTIISLLLGLYPVTSGTIRVLGRNINELPANQLRAAIGVVFQDPSLFSGTIAENLAYGRPLANQDEVKTAARNANAETFILEATDGYDTLIGERGLRLSGGQQQRLAIARAMLKDPPILVLDEATSALDTKSERLVQQGLERLLADRTSLIIAHRLSTISSVDKIITLVGGRVDEIGSPAELAKTDGLYGELLMLVASQSKQDRKLLENRFGISG